MALEPRPDFTLFADADSWWSPGTVQRMVERMRRMPHVDLLFGYFGGRDRFSPAFCYRRGGAMVDAGRDCTIGEAVEIKTAGFHFVVARTSSLAKVEDEPFHALDPSCNPPGEDIDFCVRAGRAGLRLFVDTNEMIAHVGDYGEAFIAALPLDESLTTSCSCRRLLSARWDFGAWLSARTK